MKNIFFVFILSVLIFAGNAKSQDKDIIIIKHGAKYNPITKKFGYNYISIVLNGKRGKIVCRGKGVEPFPDLKEYGLVKIDSIYHFSENMIASYLKKGINKKDTVINGYVFKWKKANLKQKNKASILEYFLYIKKQPH